MNSINNSFFQFLKLNLATLICFYLLRIVEFFYFKASLKVPADLPLFELFGFAFDTMFWASYCFVLWLVLVPIKRKEIVNCTAIIIGVLLVLSNISLQIFFVERGAPLDKELIINSLSNSITTVKSSNLINLKTFVGLTVLVIVYFFINKLAKRLSSKVKPSTTVLAIIFLLAVVNIFIKPNFLEYKYSANKTDFLVKSILSHLTDKEDRKFAEEKQFVVSDKIKRDIETYQKQFNNEFIDVDYPLLKERNTSNTIGKYFDFKAEKPNIVFLIVESLSRDISGPNAELGNFVTPFLDSLAKHSLFWGNCLSTSAISFGMLPSSLGSLPYGQYGFSMLPKYPDHLSLVKVLRANGYHSSFITGAPMHFDNQGTFMRNQGTDFLSYNFPKKYSEMNKDNGWNWGYPDKVILNYGLENLTTKPVGPYFDTYVTIVTHPPYNFDEKEEYGKIFDQRIEKLEKTKKEKQDLIKIRNLLRAFIYTDHEIERFFTSYKDRAEFNNTIFIITGDHHGYFEPKNELGKFHVPLMIYSPLLKKRKEFKSMITHLDIVPTLINMLDEEYQLNIPKYEHWLGKTMDTDANFNLNQSVPLMDWNKSLHYYVDGEYFLNKKELYQIIDDRLNIEKVNDTSVLNRLKRKLNVFKSVNAVCCYNNALMPDTLLYERNTYKNLIAEEFIGKEIQSSKKYPSTIKAELESYQTDIKVEIEFEIILPKIQRDSLPKYVISVVSDASQKKEFSDTKELSYLNNGDIRTGDWVKMTLVEHFKLSDIAQGNGMQLKAYFYNSKHIDLRIRNYSLRILN